MKSSSIYYRVADFLKRFPPFTFVGEDDLLRLAGSGRVKFEEPQGYIFWQGGTPGRFVYVIQQGTVELIDERGGESVLHDVLGEGDILGGEALTGSDGYEYSARTTSDVILYALLTDEFRALAGRHGRFARYLASTFAVTPADIAGFVRDASTGIHALDRVPFDLLAARKLTIHADAPPQEAAELMQRRRRDTLLVVEGDAPVGYVNDATWRRLAAEGEMPARVADVMTTPAPVLSEWLPLHAYASEMLLQRSSAVALVDSKGAVKSVLAESDLTLLGAPNLPRLGTEIRRAQSLAELGALRSLALRFTTQALVDASSVPWVARAFTELNRQIVSRVIELVEAEAEEPILPNRCWIFLGAAARGEWLTAALPSLGLICEDAAEPAVARLAEQVCVALERCGYREPEDAILPSDRATRRSLAEWKEAFTGWIRDPIRSRLHAGIRFFEIAPVLGDPAAVLEIRRHIRREVREHPFFAPLLANDSMANLPPLTFFQGLVVDIDGARTVQFDLRRGTLLPLADIGRVFALERADADPDSTLERLEAAGAQLPEQRELFADAAAAFRIALYHLGRSALQSGSVGWSIEPKALSKLEQQALKNGFRTIMKLLRLTAERHRIVAE